MVKILLLAVLLTGCGYTLNSMPEYDYEEASREWDIVVNLEQGRQVVQMKAMAMQFSGGSFTEQEIEQVQTHEDTYIFWKAVTEIRIFHGDYDEAQGSAKKAARGLESLNEMIDVALERVAL